MLTLFSRRNCGGQASLGAEDRDLGRTGITGFRQRAPKNGHQRQVRSNCSQVRQLGCPGPRAEQNGNNSRGRTVITGAKWHPIAVYGYPATRRPKRARFLLEERPCAASGQCPQHRNSRGRPTHALQARNLTLGDQTAGFRPKVRPARRQARQF